MLANILHFYWSETRGNILAIIPCAIAAGLWLRAKHSALKRAHERHDVKLDALLAHLDPDAETDGQLDRIADKCDETTPGGIGAILEVLKPPPPPKSVPPVKRSGKAVE